jgi:hypothetical protein
VIKIFCSLVLFFIPIFMVCQSRGKPISIDKIVSEKVTTNLQTKDAIIGEQFYFAYYNNVINFYVDSLDTDKVLVKTSHYRNLNQISLIDLNTGNFIHGIKYNPKISFPTVSTKNILFLNSAGLSRHETNNGDISYNLPLKGHATFDSLNILVGILKKQNKSKNEVNIYKFSTGQNLSKISLMKGVRLERCLALNDSIIYLSASGVHQLNIHKNTSWSYYDVTSIKRNGIVYPLLKKGLALGYSNSFYYNYEDVRLAVGVSSNILFHDKYIYKSSLNKISCLSEDGGVVWSKSLDSTTTSAAILFNSNDLIYHLNLGYAFIGIQAVNVGDPFLTFYNKDSGNSPGIISLGKEKTRITDFKIDSNYLYILLDEKIFAFQLGKLSNPITSENKISKYGELQYFEYKILYSLKDNKYISYTQDTSLLYFRNKQNAVVCFSKNLDFIKLEKSKNLWEQIGEFDKYLLIINDKTIQIITKDGTLVAIFDEIDKATLNKHSLILYNIKANKLTRINLQKALNIT